jgi:RNase H-like domain found in reverse transcriptase
LAKPLNNLLKKGIKFNWTKECEEALDALIKQVTQDLVLVAPNEDDPFELETDASAYAVGAALFRKDERGKRKAIGYASKTLIAAERNYDIWDREFLGLIFELTHWRHLLSGTKHPVKVFVDHANLLHYRHPQKVNRRVARYILTLANNNIHIQYRPGPQN